MGDITFSIADFKFGKICGYPLEINPINYEEFKIRQQMLELSIIDIKKSDYENVFRFESDEKNEIYTQGLSGSPICEIVNNLSINLRGIVTNNRHFISFSLIKTFLECTIEQNKWNVEWILNSFNRAYINRLTWDNKIFIQKWFVMKQDLTINNLEEKLKELNDRLSHLIFNNILQYSL